MSNVYSDFPQLVTRTAISIGGATSGVQTLVAAAAGKKLRLLGYKVSATTACSVKFQGVTASGQRDLTGLIVLAQGGETNEPTLEIGCLETNIGEGIALNTNAAAALGGYVNYLSIG